jgi:osmotically-inducible protein OsmY
MSTHDASVAADFFQIGKRGGTLMDDKELRRNIRNELDFDPVVNAKNIGVAVNAGVVTLTGHVRTLAERVAAEKAVRRIQGVRAIAEELEVLPEDHTVPNDEDIAQRVLNILHWDASIPNEKIQIMVQTGIVTLTGEVPWHYQRSAAEDAVRRLSGVKGVMNKVEIKPQAQAENIRGIIEDALKRIGIDPKGVRVSVRDGKKVLLEGTVRNLAERKAIEDAAWCALGVESVEDRLTLSEEP